jgi:outer membrane protein with beta-barrel domain
MRSGFAIAGWVVVLLSWPSSARAEWQIRPAVGFNFGQSSTFPAPDSNGSPSKFSLGVTGALVGEVFGIEADLARRTDFFPGSGNGGNVLSSSVTTLTGNVTVALPRHLVEYTLRPYFVGGAGLMAVRIDQFVNLLDVSANSSAIDWGGGVTGFLTNRIGLNWDVRRFRSIGEGSGPAQLSYWRVNMALAIRY